MTVSTRSHINVELLDLIVRQIEDTPEHWYQQEWINYGRYFPDGSCRTTFCIAGWAAFLTDHVDGYGRLTAEGHAWAITTRGGGYRDRDRQLPDWELLGQELLGLHSREAAWLFSGHAFATEIAVSDVNELRPRIKEYLGVDLGPRPAIPSRRASS